jgi:predicted nucleic acid-binding protein
MAASVLADAGFLVAVLSRRDQHHDWAVAQAHRLPPPWKTCEAALSEAFHLLGPRGRPALSALLQREAVTVSFDLADHVDAIVAFMEKYSDVPASLADACLVRMTELADDPLLLTTDDDFAVYRRHGRQVVPSERPRTTERRRRTE